MQLEIFSSLFIAKTEIHESEVVISFNLFTYRCLTE